MPTPLSSGEILDRLIPLPVVNRDASLLLINWIEGYLDDLGVSARRVPNDDGTKASLDADMGPEARGEVVPPTRPPWSRHG